MILPIFRKNQGRGFIAERISEPACAFPHGGIGEGKDEHGSFLGFNCCAVSVTGVGGSGSRAVNLRSFARLTTPANLPLSAPVTATSTGDGSVLPTVPVLQVLPGVIQVGVIIFLKYDFFYFYFLPILAR